MSVRSSKLALLLFLVICVCTSLPVWAQSLSTGTVSGSVTDQTGAVVAGATVALTDVSTNNPRTTTTNSSGRYIFVDVTPGIYNVTISREGFETTKTERQEVKVGSLLTLNLALRLGRATEVVEVTSVGNELQTMNATVGNTVTASPAPGNEFTYGDMIYGGTVDAASSLMTTIATAHAPAWTDSTSGGSFSESTGCFK